MICRRRGFTLIELLVVIAIIALLAAILFPVFARVRENARKSACQSNLKQIALGFHQYTQDYDGRLPHAWDISPQVPASPANTVKNPPNNDPVIWPAKLEPYLKSRQIFSCPSVGRMRSSPCATTSYTSIQHEWASSDPVVGTAFAEWYRGASQVAYGYNVQYLGGGQFTGRLTCQHVVRPTTGECYTCGVAAMEASIAQSAGTILLIDNTWQNQGISTAPAFFDIFQSFDSAGDYWCSASGANEPYDTADPRHNGGLNVAFLDGHVKWLKKEVAVYRPAGGVGCNTMTSAAAMADPKFLWDRY